MSSANDAEDEANVHKCLLTLLTHPGILCVSLESKTGRIAPDLGIRALMTYVLCCRVLGRLGHVNCPRKQVEAVRRMEIMLTGGIAKKRKRLGGTSSRRETRDRVFAYIESCVMAFIAEDVSGMYGEPDHTKELYYAMTKGDELLRSILSTVKDSPSLSGILPITILSFVCVLVELFMTGSVEMDGVDVEKLAEFRHFETYCALEKVSLHMLKAVHPGSGVIVGGDGRPMFSPSSIHGRDGEVSRIAISNTALASALGVGSRMSVPSSNSKRKEESDGLGLDTFFPFVMDAVMHSSAGEREYQSTMEEVFDFLSEAPTDSLVAKTALNLFFKSYETLIRCNRITVLCFKGPGVLSRSRHAPEVVRCRKTESEKKNPSIREEVLGEIDKVATKFRRVKDSCLDSERVVVKANGEKTTKCVCSFALELCHFLSHCIKLAEKVVTEAGKDGSEGRFPEVRQQLCHDLILGLFARDISGNISELYEDYVYSSLMRHFNERDGVSKTLLRSGRRRHVFRSNSKRSAGEREGARGGDVQLASGGRGEYSLEDEEWAPSN